KEDSAARVGERSPARGPRADRAGAPRVASVGPRARPPLLGRGDLPSARPRGLRRVTRPWGGLPRGGGPGPGAGGGPISLRVAGDRRWCHWRLGGRARPHGRRAALALDRPRVDALGRTLSGGHLRRAAGRSALSLALPSLRARARDPRRRLRLRAP